MHFLILTDCWSQIHLFNNLRNIVVSLGVVGNLCLAQEPFSRADAYCRSDKMILYDSGSFVTAHLSTVGSGIVQTAKH